MSALDSIIVWMKKPWVIALYAVFVVLIYLFVDRPLALYWHALDLDSNLRALKWFTRLGSWLVYLALFFVAACHFRYVGKQADLEKKAWYLFLCVLIPNLVASALKVSLSRARPELLFANNQYGFYWFQFSDAYWSFPSGHAVTVGALATGVSVLLPRYCFALYGLALAVAASRVLLTNHYLSDVLAGFYLGILLVVLITPYFQRKKLLE